MGANHYPLGGFVDWTVWNIYQEYCQVGFLNPQCHCSWKSQEIYMDKVVVWLWKALDLVLLSVINCWSGRRNTVVKKGPAGPAGIADAERTSRQGEATVYVQWQGWTGADQRLNPWVHCLSYCISLWNFTLCSSIYTMYQIGTVGVHFRPVYWLHNYINHISLNLRKEGWLDLKFDSFLCQKSLKKAHANVSSLYMICMVSGI